MFDSMRDGGITADTVFLGGFGTFALLFHFRVKTGRIHRKTVRRGDCFRQVDGEPIGIVEDKSIVAGR